MGGWIGMFIHLRDFGDFDVVLPCILVWYILQLEVPGTSQNLRSGRHASRMPFLVGKLPRETKRGYLGNIAAHWGYSWKTSKHVPVGGHLQVVHLTTFSPKQAHLCPLCFQWLRHRAAGLQHPKAERIKISSRNSSAETNRRHWIWDYHLIQSHYQVVT